jgi:hypothetical protein
MKTRDRSNGLVSAITTRKLRVGNFFIALEQLRGHLQQQDCEAAQERASAICHNVLDVKGANDAEKREQPTKDQYRPAGRDRLRTRRCDG